MSFRLTAPARVVFTVHGPSPSCGIVGTKSVRGRRGVNTVHITGRFNGHALAPGTYSIVVVAQRGPKRKRVGRISVQVVPPGQRMRRAGSPPVFSCSPASTGSQAQTGIPGSGLFVSTPSKTEGAPVRPPQAKPEPTPGRSGVLAEPPFHLETGSGSLDMILALLLYATLGIGGAVLIVYTVRFFRGTWSP